MRSIVGAVVAAGVALCALATGAEVTTGTAAGTRLPRVSEIAEDLGPQVLRAMIMRSDVGQDAKGRDLLYTAVLGAPATFAVVDVNTGELVTSRSLTGTSGAWGIKAAPDGTVYIGTYLKGHVFRYFPDTDELKDLGDPFKFEEQVIYPMDVMPDGRVFGGAYPSGHAYMYDPSAGKFQDLGDVTTQTERERWIRVTAVDPEHEKVYFGIGSDPQLVEYDIKTGEKRDILPARYKDITAVYDLNVAGGRLFCRKETSNPYEYFVLDAQTREPVLVNNADTGETTNTFVNPSRGLSPKSPVANKMYFGGKDEMLHEYDLDTNTIRKLDAKVGLALTGYAWVKLKDKNWPGYTLTGTVGNRPLMYRYNLVTGKAAIMPIELPQEPVNIHDIELGPDGKIYMGGYLAGNAAVYDPATGKTTRYAGSGQPEGMTFVGSKLYMGIYPDARIYEWDTAKPWNMDNMASPVNPRRLFSLEKNGQIPGYTEQERPFGMVGAEDLHKLFIGTVPKNGRLGGAFTVYDTQAGGEPEVHWNLIPNQSIVALEYKDGLVYGGTTVYGGMGAKPVTPEALLFVWDPAKKNVVNKLVPVPGKQAVNVLANGPDGNIWGIAQGTVFVYDAKARKVIRREEVTKTDSHYRDASLVTGADGMVYGTTGGVLFRMDAKDGGVEKLASGANKIAQDKAGVLYITGEPKANLLRWNPRK